MKLKPFPAVQSEWLWLTEDNRKIRSKVILTDEQEDAVMVRPVSYEEYRLTEDEKQIRTLPLQDFLREYEAIPSDVNFTNVQVHEFCLTTYLAGRLHKYIVGVKVLNQVKLAGEFMFQHGIDNRPDLLPSVTESVREWWNKWEGKQEFLTKLKK